MARYTGVFRKPAANPGRPVVALCRWDDFNYDRDREDRNARLWNPRDEPPTACRASLGDSRVTIWLPQGARIVKRHRGNTGGELREVYGSHDRMTRTRIRITLTELPNLGA